MAIISESACFPVVVPSLNGFELLAVLCVIGLLMVLSVRLRVRSHTILLLVIIGLLFLALISLGRVTMTLFAAVVALLILLIVFVFRGWFESKLLRGSVSKSLNQSYCRVRRLR